MKNKLFCFVLIISIILILNVMLSLYILCLINTAKDMDNFAAIPNVIKDINDYKNLSFMLVDSEGNISTNKLTLGEVAMVNKTNFFTEPQVFDVLDNSNAARASNTGKNRQAIIVNSGFVDIAKGDLVMSSWKQGTDLVTTTDNVNLNFTARAGTDLRGKNQRILIEHGHIAVKDYPGAANSGNESYIAVDAVTSNKTTSSGAKKWDISKTGRISTQDEIQTVSNIKADSITSNNNVSGSSPSRPTWAISNIGNIETQGHIITHHTSTAENPDDAIKAMNGKVYFKGAVATDGAVFAKGNITTSSGKIRTESGSIETRNGNIFTNNGHIVTDNGNILAKKTSQTDVSRGNITAWQDIKDIDGKMMGGDGIYVISGYAWADGKNKDQAPKPVTYLADSQGQRDVNSSNGYNPADWLGGKEKAMRVRFEKTVAGNDCSDNTLKFRHVGETCPAGFRHAGKGLADEGKWGRPR